MARSFRVGDVRHAVFRDRPSALLGRDRRRHLGSVRHVYVELGRLLQMEVFVLTSSTKKISTAAVVVPLGR